MTKRQYIERVRDALNTSDVLTMPKSEYAEALEEISADLEGMIDAVQQELLEENGE